jgi:hypothetical protein
MFFGIGKVWKWSVISEVLGTCYIHQNAISIEIPFTFKMGAEVYAKQLPHTPQNKSWTD